MERSAVDSIKFDTEPEDLDMIEEERRVCEKPAKWPRSRHCERRKNTCKLSSRLIRRVGIGSSVQYGENGLKPKPCAMLSQMQKVLNQGWVA